VLSQSYLNGLSNVRLDFRIGHAFREVVKAFVDGRFDGGATAFL
jgi:hypothetical protein